MDLSSSLNDLKDKISESDDFGPLPRGSQRIFHLGRELKTGGRSLAALGVGRFKVFTVHLFSKEGRASSVEESGKRRKKGKDKDNNNNSRKNKRRGANEDDDEDDGAIRVDGSPKIGNTGRAASRLTATTRASTASQAGAPVATNRRQTGRQAQTAIEVLEIGSSSDDDDVVEVVQTISTKKRRRRD